MVQAAKKKQCELCYNSIYISPTQKKQLLAKGFYYVATLIEAHILTITTNKNTCTLPFKKNWGQ